jgi:hypothetical protein
MSIILNVDYQVATTKVQTWQTYEDWGSAALLDGRIPQRKKIPLDVGTLVLDMYDTGRKALVWTGTAEKTIDPNSSREARQKILNKAAKKSAQQLSAKVTQSVLLKHSRNRVSTKDYGRGNKSSAWLRIAANLSSHASRRPRSRDRISRPHGRPTLFAASRCRELLSSALKAESALSICAFASAGSRPSKRFSSASIDRRGFNVSSLPTSPSRNE